VADAGYVSGATMVVFRQHDDGGRRRGDKYVMEVVLGYDR